MITRITAIQENLINSPIFISEELQEKAVKLRRQGLFSPIVLSNVKSIYIFLHVHFSNIDDLYAAVYLIIFLFSNPQF
jgi:hypothetical protein